jgi:hypothetical protein
MNCVNCGSVLASDGSFCEQCGTAVPVPARAAPASWPGAVPAAPPSPAAPSPAAPSPAAVAPLAAPLLTGEPPAALAPVARGTLPGSPVLLGDGEVLCRTYEAVRLRRRSLGTGTLFVTDARVVFYAWAKGRRTQRASAMVREVKLEDICGYSAYVTRRLNFFLLVVSGIFILATLGSLFGREFGVALLFAALAAGAIALLFSEWAQRGTAGVTIRARGNDQSEVRFGGAGHRNPLMDLCLLLMFPLLIFMRSYTAFDVELGRPGEHSEAIIAELGALVMDLQTRGALSAGYWGIAAGAGAAGPAVRVPGPR